MGLIFGLLLTLVGGATLGVAAWLALIGHPAETPLIGTGAMLGAGLFLVYGWFAKRNARFDY
jgi:hypothetical protein